MSRYSIDPVKHVISFRVTEVEKELLQDLVTATGMNISTLLRKAISLIEARHSWFLRN